MYREEDVFDHKNGALECLMDLFAKNGITCSIQEDWKDSQAAFEIGKMYFLEEDYVIEMNKILKLPDEAVSELLRALSLIKDSITLSRLLWHYHYILYICKKSVSNEVVQISNAAKSRQANPSMIFELLPAVVALSGLAEAIKLHQRWDIPYHVTVDTFSDIRIWMEDYHRKHGKWGLSELPWLHSHLTGRLFRIGRLQYVYEKYTGKIRVFRSKSSKEIKVFPETGQKYRKDGLLDGTNHIYDKEDVWVSNLSAEDKCIFSNCILLNGYAFRKDIMLPLDEWETILSAGDSVLAMHIPAGSRLDLHECRESLIHSSRFYQKHFPKLSINAFCCGSWLLEPQLQKILSPASNIVQFQRLFHLYPILGDEAPFLDRVFGYRQENLPDDLDMLPGKTSLQLAIKDYLISGNRIHPAAGVIFPEELVSDSFCRVT